METAKSKALTSNCEDCDYYEWDEESEAFFCSCGMDEDDLARLVEGRSHGKGGYCPYYRHQDEYQLVKHQM